MDQKRSFTSRILAIPKNFWQLKKKEKILVILALFTLVGILWLGVWGVSKMYRQADKQVYEVAVFAHDQSGQVRSAHRIGDALVIQNEDHSWSQTERISYLILKMELTEDQKNKLLMADEREIPEKEWSEEERQRAEEEKRMAKEEGREYRPEPRRETLRPRLYRIDLEDKSFEKFSRDDLIDGQPYMNQVFDWKVVERKKKL